MTRAVGPSSAWPSAPLRHCDLPGVVSAWPPGSRLGLGQGPGHRSAPLAVSGTRDAGFELLPPALTGLSFTNRLFGEMFLTNAVAHNGAGVAASDVDGDVTVEQLEAVRVGGRWLPVRDRHALEKGLPAPVIDLPTPRRRCSGRRGKWRLLRSLGQAEKKEGPN